MIYKRILCPQFINSKAQPTKNNSLSVLQDYPEEKTIGSTTFEFVEGDPANRELLQKSGVAFCDSVIIGGILDERPAKEADALTITLVMLLQECLAAAGRDESNPAHIVGMVSSLPPPASPCHSWQCPVQILLVHSRFWQGVKAISSSPAGF